MKELINAWKTVDRNKVALILSVVPGLGHLYKHHYLAGAGLMLLGNLMVLFAAAWLAIATLGLSLIVVPVAWMAVVACSAYHAEDRHGTHAWLHRQRHGVAGYARGAGR